ncbi:unnamed protein product [Cladocopium goreaui]|uniref:Potassium voltage-gated channel subfamily H member 6 n=1 Tax=Cladocopium goreaui TaxID=2562237 RepID=A0A9P1G597_9DINO|nr:unnamed protein product [Cladocopium goreaui]|mmetsp:Transcript_66280/g.134666  ORF Transcript_66280/g.134666 Transcript_66280/m.134666 type:complete len:732 (-) Transcript_66280:140-2335(-)
MTESLGKGQSDAEEGNLTLEMLWSERLTSVHKQLEQILSDLHRQLCADHHLAIQSLKDGMEQATFRKAEGASKLKRPRSIGRSPSLWTTGLSSDSLYQLQKEESQSVAMFDRTMSGVSTFPKPIQIGSNLIQPWPLWKESQGADVVRNLAHEKSKAVAMVDSGAQQLWAGSSAVFSSAPVPTSCTIRPSSLQFLFWNLIFLVVLFYDCVSFPLSAFRIEHLFVKPNLIAASFWTLDFVLSFFVGYDTTDGVVETRLPKTAARYARTWMLPDLIVIVVDWVMLYLALAENDSAASPAGFARIGKSVRYMRIMRVMRLLRLRKIQEALHQADEFVNIQYFSIIQKLLLNMVWILLLSHFIGCGWYAIGMEDFSPEESWISVDNLLDRSLEYRYLTALHWSITQFTPGSMNVQPVNSVERLYSVVVLVLGMVVFSSTVSSITAATNNLKDINAVYKHQIWTLRRYFREQKISAQLTHRVLRYTESMIKPKYQKVNVDQVKILAMLPQMLTKEVNLEIYQKHLVVHPLFDALSDINITMMQKLCSCALKDAVLEKGEMMFSPGQVCNSMSFVCQGTLDYWMWQESHPEKLERRTFFCEAVLWTPWIHQGRMYARTESTIIALDAHEFHEVAQSFSAHMELLRSYAEEFVRAMNELAGNFTEDEDDDTELSDLFFAMQAIEMLPGNRSFEEGTSRPHHFKKPPRKLRTPPESPLGGVATKAFSEEDLDDEIVNGFA